MNIVIIGCGSLGRHLVKAFLDLESPPYIVIVDRSQEALKLLPVEFKGFGFVRDASELSVLEEAKIERADVALMITNDENLNLMLAQVAKEIYKVPKVIARVIDEDKKKSFEFFGITTINPMELAAREMVGYAVKE